MALRDSKFLLAIFYLMGGMLVLGFCLRIYLGLTSTVGDGTYLGGRGLLIHYSSAAISIISVAAVVAVWGIARIIRRLRDRRDQRNGV